MCVCTEIYSKELVHVVMEIDKSKICRIGCQAGDPEKSQSCHSSMEAVCWLNSLLLGESVYFVLFRTSTNWARPTLMLMEGNLLYSKSPDSNAKLILKHSH